MGKMNSIIITTILSPLLLLTIACTEKKQTFYDAGTIKEEFFVKRRSIVRHGSATGYYGNGVKSFVREYCNDVLDGIDSSFDTTGALSSLHFYKSGLKNGPFVTYFGNGKPKIAGTFVNDLLHDTLTMWYSNGIKEHETYYQNGIPSGGYQAWHDNGYPSYSFSYDYMSGFGGSKHRDSFPLWDSIGEKEGMGYFSGEKSDIPVDPFPLDWPDTEAWAKFKSYGRAYRHLSILLIGKQIRVYGISKYYGAENAVYMLEDINGDIGDANGTIHKFYPDRKLLEERPVSIRDVNMVDNGVLMRWHSSGQVCMIDTILNGLREGVSVSYHTNGQIARLANYKRDKLTGVRWEYYSNSNPRTEEHFVQGELSGIKRVWSSNGALFLEESYLKGEWSGTRVEYYETGQKKSECTYKYGRPVGQCREWRDTSQVSH